MPRFLDCAGDVFLWRDIKVSAGVLVTATAIYVLFNVLEFYFFTVACRALFLGLIVLFLWSYAAIFIRSCPRMPELSIPEAPYLKFASALRIEIDQALASLRAIASVKQWKKFLSTLTGLWVMSIVGSWCDFLTLLYTITVALFTLPLFYEKYETEVDSFAETAMDELKKKFLAFGGKVLSKILREPLDGNEMNEHD